MVQVEWHSRYSSRIDAMGHSDVVAILKLAERPDIISFAGGLPDPQTFLLDETQGILGEILVKHGHKVLGYGPTAGITPFRAWIATHMTESGRKTELEECLITTGGIAALDLLCKVLLDPGDMVVVGEPAYVAALQVVKSYQGRFAGVRVDDDGMIPEQLEAELAALDRQGSKAKFIYLVPSFQNPSGVTLSVERRNQILEIAAAYETPIIEDGAYEKLCYEGEMLPSLAALDPDQVIHINTFSKVFNPGVRIGWITASQSLIDTLILAKQSQDQCSSTIGQFLAHEFAVQGLINRQNSVAKDLYKRKRDITLAALDEYFPSGSSWTRPTGGFYIWVTLPKSLDTDVLLGQAIDSASVAYVAGPAFFHDRKGQNHLRICFSFVAESHINEGIRRLGQFLAALI